MTAITISVDVAKLNIHQVKLKRIYDWCGIDRTENDMLSSYIYCLLEFNGIPFYRWTDEGNGGMLI